MAVDCHFVLFTLGLLLRSIRTCVVVNIHTFPQIAARANHMASRIVNITRKPLFFFHSSCVLVHYTVVVKAASPLSSPPRDQLAIGAHMVVQVREERQREENLPEVEHGLICFKYEVKSSTNCGKFWHARSVLVYFVVLGRSWFGCTWLNLVALL